MIGWYDAEDGKNRAAQYDVRAFIDAKQPIKWPPLVPVLDALEAKKKEKSKK